MAAVKISELPAVTTPDFNDQFAVVDISTNVTSGVSLGVVRKKPAYSWAELPDASTYQWQIVVVTDDESSKYPGDSTLVYSDGTVWRYVGDGSPIKMEEIPAVDIVFSSTPPMVALLKVDVPTGDVAFSTTAPILRIGTNITSGSGAIQVTTVAPAVMPISIPVAQLSITTFPAHGIPINPDSTDMDMTTTVPWLGELAETPQSDLAFSTTAPTKVATHNIIYDSWTDLSITTVAPSVRSSVPVPQGDVAISTTAPTMGVGNKEPIPQSDLALSMTAPTVSQTTSESDIIPQVSLVTSVTAPTVVQTTNEADTIPQSNLATSTTAPTVS
jgi:hypothetical protein